MSSLASKRQRSHVKSDQHPSKKRRIRRQTDYHSSSSEASESDEQDDPTDPTHELVESAKTKDTSIDDGEEAEVITEAEDDQSDSDMSNSASEDSDADEDDNPNNVKVRKKRNDPAAFANSMSRILNTKLTVSKRADPVLSRSKDASAASKETQDAKLEAKVKQQIREEKRARLETGRVKDVLGLQDPDVSTEDIMAREKRYKKLAQQGVIRLFNAVLAAQMKGQEASKTAKQEGVVGMAKRDEKVNEMSKQGFLDLITSSSKK